ncbi:MAG: hypothetical protein HQL87_07820 [Magnetococcales bacterium]|nr:hypothetical protein [Magnetococcales bacterium]
MIGGPNQPRSSLGRVQGFTISVEATKVYGWNSHGILVVAANDTRLTWAEQELVRQLGAKLYGRRQREKHHGQTR